MTPQTLINNKADCYIFSDVDVWPNRQDHHARDCEFARATRDIGLHVLFAL